MRTFCHRNLHTGLWSITQKHDGRMQIVAQAKHVEMINVTPKQNTKLLHKIRARNRRGVCTMAEGQLVYASGLESFKGRPTYLVDAPGARPVDCTRVVTFNPHVDDTLVYDAIGSKKEFKAATYAVFNAQHQMLVNP